jgi:hypothetical protein
MINRAAELTDSIHIAWEECNKASAPLSSLEFLNLCGGIPFAHTEEVFLKIKQSTSVSYDISVRCASFYADRIINLEERTIFNSSLRVTDPGYGMGTNLLFNQIRASRRLGFQRLNVVALSNEGYNGHDHWGRAGFIPYESEMEAINKWCLNRGLEFPGSIDQLLENPYARKLWQANGLTWYGQFLLDNGSSSMEIFKRKLQKFQLNHFAELL